MSILRKTQQHCEKKAINVAVACIATSFSLPVFCIFLRQSWIGIRTITIYAYTPQHQTKHYN